jgi:protein-disulfide isomerase
MRFLLLIILVIMPLSVSYARANASRPVTQGELDGLIRQYLLDHPEVIVDALEGMQRKEMKEASAKASKIVSENTSAVYEDILSPSVGNPKAPVTIVEFSDYNCSACKFMFNAIERVMKEQKGQVRLLVKEFPIFGAQSHELAGIAIAANKLDPKNYFAFHSALMKEPGRLDATKVDNALMASGYDPESVRARAKEEDIMKAIERNLSLGEKLGVRGTPTLIVGDEFVPHALDFEALNRKVSAQAKK